MPTLDVPYRSQYGNKIYNDCGEANVSMIIQYATGRNLSIHEIEVAMGREGKLDTPTNLVQALGKAAGIAAVVESRSNLPRLQTLISKGTPVIALVDYGDMPDRNKTDKVFADGHYILIVGFEGNTVVYHDPLHPGVKGRNMRMSISDLQYAWDTSQNIFTPDTIIIPTIHIPPKEDAVNLSDRKKHVIEKLGPQLEQIFVDGDPITTTQTMLLSRGRLDGMWTIIHTLEKALLTMGAKFDEDAYLKTYPDVASEVKAGRMRSGEYHYTRFGKGEGRMPAYVLPKPAPAGKYVAVKEQLYQLKKEATWTPQSR